jgi:hypothetical protein
VGGRSRRRLPFGLVGLGAYLGYAKPIVATTYPTYVCFDLVALVERSVTAT